MSHRELKNRKNRIPRVSFEFFTFSAPKSPLAISAPEKKAKQTKTRDCLGGPSVVCSNRNTNILEGKNEEQKRFPTWSWKKRGKRTCFVQRAEALSTENIVSDALLASNLKQRSKTRGAKKASGIGKRGVLRRKG